MDFASPMSPAPTASPWQPLIYKDVLHAPDAYGVTVIGNSRQEPVLVTPGVIRDELWRLVNDPLSKVHDAVYFRFYVTVLNTEAQKLADELLRVAGQEDDRRVFWRYFPAPD